MELYTIDSAPIREGILLYWKENGHFEEGFLYKYNNDGEEGIDYIVSGGGYDNFPTHWAELPKFEFKE